MAGFLHVAVGLVGGRLAADYARPRADRPASSARPPSRGLALGAFVALSLLPDVDVIAFALGIPYEAPFGHRGATHSFAFALLAGVLLGGPLGRIAGLAPSRSALLAALVTASHGVLDASTDGGLGVALFWPLSAERSFLPWRPLPVSPIGPAVLTSARGLQVLGTELLLSLPLLAYAFRRGITPGSGAPDAR